MTIDLNYYKPTEETCAQCGGTLWWHDCWECDEGYIDEYEDDPINYMEGESYYTCGHCGGNGGWLVCLDCLEKARELVKG